MLQTIMVAAHLHALLLGICYSLRNASIGDSLDALIAG